MYDFRLRFLATVFVDADSIVASSSDLRELADKLADDRFLPISISEPSQRGVANRIAYAAPDAGLQIVLAGRRLDYTLLPRPTHELPPADEALHHVPSGPKEFRAFCEEAKGKTGAILGYFGLKGHRLAAVQEGFLRAMPSEEMDGIACRLFRYPPAFVDNPPFEWDWRLACRSSRYLGAALEQMSTVATVKRMTGEMVTVGQTPTRKRYERIRVDMDVNTTIEESRPRFGDEEIHRFFEGAGDWHEQLGEELSDFMLGDSRA